MQNDAPDDALALRWLNWWQYDFWFQADDSWRTQRFATLPQATQAQFLRQHARLWQQELGIPHTPLHPPEPLVLAISALNTLQRTQLLALVAEICGGTSGLPAELKIWLRRLAKGMRTDCWLPQGLFQGEGCADSLLLLRALYPALWPRLRLLFPVSIEADAPLILPAHRLRPLWEAALWQAQQNSGERRNVET